MKACPFISLLLCLSLLSNAQISHPKRGFITLDAIIRRHQRDTLLIYITPFDYADFVRDNVEVYTEGLHKFTLITDSLGEIHFTFPIPYDKPQNINLLLSSAPELQIASVDVAEPGDHICFKLNGSGKATSFRFYGKDATKYNCQREFDEEVFRYADSVQHAKEASPSFYTLANIKALCLTSAVSANRMIQHYQHVFQPSIYTFLKAKEDGRLLGIAVEQLLETYKRSDTGQKKELIHLLSTLVGPNLPFTPEVLVNTVSWEPIFEQTAGYQCSFDSENGNYTLMDLYNQVKNEYSRSIRDCVLLNILRFAPNAAPLAPTDEQVDSLWKDATTVFTSPFLRQYAAKRAVYHLKGLPMHDFSFPDPTGRPVTLADLKGKVVLVDFWFTGCPWCRAYASRLEETIYPKYRNNSQVVFLSVCSDGSKEGWLKSVKGGQYTSEENLNVYTGGEGFANPLTKYYDIIGGPISILIDRAGKIAAFDPTKTDMHALDSLIKETLNGSL